MTAVMSVPVQAGRQSLHSTQLPQKPLCALQSTPTAVSLVTVNCCHRYSRTDVNIWRSDHLEIYWDRYHITERTATATVNTLNNLAFQKTDTVIQLIDLWVSIKQSSGRIGTGTGTGTRIAYGLNKCRVVRRGLL